MKVVIFCGGLGIRMGEATQSIPKPMIPIGGRPILWHIMKYYAAWGHRDFILCLGYKAEVVKEFFLTYNEALANDFVQRHRRMVDHVRRHRDAGDDR
jgi:glucose-1-phosphate cytidylyltransferase